jgi:hypothetical protein
LKKEEEKEEEDVDDEEEDDALLNLRKWRETKHNKFKIQIFS